MTEVVCFNIVHHISPYCDG